MITVETRGPEATRALGAAAAGLLQPGDVMLLVGTLGAGKTTFVQGLAAGLGFEGDVTSPTFTLSHEYAARLRLVHADLWRLTTVNELLDLSFEEELEEGAVLVAEWGEGAEVAYGRDALVVSLEACAVDVRQVTFEPRGARWVARAEALRRAVEAP